MVVLDMSFGTSGKHADRFIMRNSGARNRSSPTQLSILPDKSGRINSPDHLYMDGIGVMSFFNQAVPESVLEMLNKHRKSIDDISFFVFHQASQLALDGITRSLNIPANKILIDMENTGNLVSASIPVVLANCMAKNSFTKGQFVILCGFGVGLSWSTALVQF
jgi:3-oxoacyl-[acyl-carrier-protein] synthase-3